MPFKIRAKLLIAFFIMLIPFFVFAYFSNLTYKTIHKNNLRMDLLHKQLDTYSKVQLGIDMLLMPPNDYLITGDIREKENFTILAGELEAVVDGFSRVIEDRQGHSISVNIFDRFLGFGSDEFHKDEIEFLKELKKDIEEIKWNGIEIFSIENPIGSKFGGEMMEKMDALAHRIVTITIARHMATDRIEFVSAIEASAIIWIRTSILLSVSFIISVVSGIGFAFYYSRFFVRPIKALHNGTERLAGGELDYRLNIRTGDEIEQLGRAFNVMGEKLKESYSELEEKVQERTRDLQVERDKFINVLNTMTDGVYICNQSYDVVYVNPALEKDFGSYHGRKCYEYFHDRSEVCPWCPNHEVWAGKTVRWEWYSSKNGSTYDLMDTPLRNPDGSVDKLEIFRDITESKKAGEELKHRIDELERFQRVAVQREFRIKELRDQIRELERELQEAEGRQT